jgi:ribonuclease J
MVGPKFDTTVSAKTELSHIPPLKDGDIRIIHLGGVEEIGRNMSLIEYKDTIVVVDCGVQFTETHTPGIDFILPNTRYLEENKHKIKGILVTHGHLDHIGSIPYIMPRIGNPQLYARLFTSLMIRKRQEEFPHLAPLTINVVEKDDSITFGDLRVRFFGVTHAIPDSMGIIVETPYGDIVHTGDLRLEHNDNIPTDDEVERYKLFENRNVLLLMADSTNCENPGFSISDTVVYKNIEAIIKEASGRLIISTFASQVERMLFMLETAEKHGKKVVVEGRSMKTNVEIAKLANMLKVRPETLIPLEDMVKYPENKIIILATGQQGEEFAALGRIANKTHKFIRLTPKDTILMSSSVVPGNERAVQNLKDKLSRQGAHLIHYKTSDVHSSGHANADELLWIHRKIHPKFFVPVHGYHYMLRVHADLERKLGMME